MTKETTFFAFDFRAFDTEEECAAYEKQVKKNADSVVFLDYQFKRINPFDEPGLDDIEEAICSATYIIVRNSEAANEFFDWMRLSIGFNWDGLPKGFDDANTTWAYDDDAEEWYNPVACMKYYTDIVSKLNEVSGCR